MNATIAVMAAVIAACIGVAVVIFWVTGKKYKRSAGLILAGGLGFFITQALVRMPLLQAFGSRLEGLGPVALALILGCSAALFETSGRLAAASATRERSASPAGGMLLGLGHGLSEMFVVLVGAYINNLVLLLGDSGAVSEVAAQVKQALAATPLWMFAVAFGERLMVMVFHTLMSVLIARGFMTHKKAAFALLVFALHAALDTAVVLIANRFGPLWTELLVAAVAAGCLVALLKTPGLRKGAGLPADEAAQAAGEGY